MGKSLFADIKDSTAKIQIYVQKQALGEDQFDLFKHFIDLGDIVGVGGKLFTTHAGELTVKVESVTLLSKAIQPLPKEWYGIKDVETRLRQRYGDRFLDHSGKSLRQTGRSRNAHVCTAGRIALCHRARAV